MHTMLNSRFTAFVLGCLLVMPAAGAQDQGSPAQTSFPGVGRVIAFADVHGAYADLVSILQKAGVVDAALHWAAGTTHVVSVGDLLDRGAESRKVLDLLMRLQSEASAAGGQLHVVLGNHEAMNVLGDLRYVTPEEYASYAADEPQGERERQLPAWTARGLPAAEFERSFPVGFFGHRSLLGANGRYGKWLLSLPVAIVVNDTLYMHGGPSQVLAGQTLPEINLRYRTALVDHLRTAEALRTADLLYPGDEFADWATLAAKRLEERKTQAGGQPLPDGAALDSAVKNFASADRNPMLEPEGPNWYRGAALCHEASERDVLQPVLDKLGVKRLVIGHTVARNTRVATRFEGTVYKLDSGMNRAAYKGRPSALVIDGSQPPGVVYADDAAGPQPPPYEGIYLSSATLTEPEVESLLANGTVSLTGPSGPGSFDVSVEQAGQRIAATFVSGSQAVVNRELAAWRLDRALGLGLVPATVAREVQGQRGYLQARPAKWTSQAVARAQGMRGGGDCAFERQFQLMYAFDAVTGNEGRSADRVLFDTAQWTLLLTGHDRAFGTGQSLPAYLKASPPKPGPEIRRRLASLDQAAVASALDGLLSEKELRALLARRDALLSAESQQSGASR